MGFFFTPPLLHPPLTSLDKRDSPHLSLPSHPKGRLPVPLPHPGRPLHLAPLLSTHLLTCDVIILEFSLFLFPALYLFSCGKWLQHLKAVGFIPIADGFQNRMPKHVCRSPRDKNRPPGFTTGGSAVHSLQRVPHIPKIVRRWCTHTTQMMVQSALTKMAELRSEERRVFAQTRLDTFDSVWLWFTEKQTGL